MESLPSDFLPPDQSLQPQSPARSTKVRYLSICQAGIVAAAVLGIDLAGIIKEDAEIQLGKQTKERKDSPMTPSHYGAYRPRSSGSLKQKISCGDSNSIVYGTYRRKHTEDDPLDKMATVSHPNLIDLDDISSPICSYELINASNSYDPYANRHSRNYDKRNRFSNPELDSINRNTSGSFLGGTSPNRRASSPVEFNLEDPPVKPQRPNTLNVTPEHSVVQTKPQPERKLGISKSSSGIATQIAAFGNSNTSSSSQSPASQSPSTPSPKLVTRNVRNLIDMDLENDNRALPKPLIESRKHRFGSTTSTGSTGDRKPDTITFL